MTRGSGPSLESGAEGLVVGELDLAALRQAAAEAGELHGEWLEFPGDGGSMEVAERGGGEAENDLFGLAARERLDRGAEGRDALLLEGLKHSGLRHHADHEVAALEAAGVLDG